MLAHRIDYGHFLVGPIAKLVSDQQRFLDTRAGGSASDLDDWVAILAATPTVRPACSRAPSSPPAARGHYGQDLAEVNGPTGRWRSRRRSRWNCASAERARRTWRPSRCPRSFLVYPGSTRDPSHGDPVATFRYDQNVEFIAAIREGRPCKPSLWDGARVQAVMDAAIRSAAEGRWVDVPPVGP
jgi:predicted dehydrogenase